MLPSVPNPPSRRSSSNSGTTEGSTLPFASILISVQTTHVFITNDFAANDLACQEAMKAYAARLQQEETRREAIRSGKAPMVQSTVWYISDRD